MKPSIDWLEYQRLELIIPPSPPRSKKQLSWQRLIAACDTFLQAFVRPAEPQVWQTLDTAGNVWWSACDPATNRVIQDVSEEQIRVWLEQRYQ